VHSIHIVLLQSTTSIEIELNCHLIDTREFPGNTVGRDVCSIRKARLVSIPDSHTADNIVDELKGVLSDWSLPQQGIAATTDNGANIKSAIEMFDCPHFSRFSHTLQLEVEQAWKTSRGCKDD